MKRKSILRAAWDFIGTPFRLVLFDQRWLARFGWTTLEEDRIRAVLPHIRGRLLDVGAGANTLVKTYGNGLGVDVHDFGGGAVIVENSGDLPFESCSFDTITFIACLNHIPYRQAALREARRLVKPGGRLILTMINPILGGLGHRVWWYGEDRRRGGMAEGEVGGMWSGRVKRLCEAAGFALALHRRFVYGMNHLYVFRPADSAQGQAPSA